ncbi:MAG: septum formation protein Maf [Propionibacterium sp.]|nr:MAG: septum formation protein Maf [Propionibacterium sp.]
MRVILASQSAGRLEVLRRAGIDPEVVVSGVDESAVTSRDASELTLALAELKGQAVLDLVTDSPAVVIACDSVLEFRGQTFGKPKDAEQARDRWRKMRGSGGVLHTGHFVAARTNDTWRISKRVANTVVRFADLSDAEIDAYIETGEPLFVAGAFTIDGLGGPFIIRIDGDPHNVVGISLPLVRQMLLDLEIPWHTLWKSN